MVNYSVEFIVAVREGIDNRKTVNLTTSDIEKSVD